MSVDNFYRRKLRSLTEILGIPFGHDIVTDQKPQQLTNKTIDYNKNSLLNLPTGGGSVPDGDETTKGKVQFATNNESAALKAVQGNDSRMSNSRSPLAHTHVKVDVTDFAHAHLAADLPSDVVYDSDISNVIREGDSRLTDSRSPLAHTHIKADITDFSHTHIKSDITDFAHSHLAADLPNDVVYDADISNVIREGDSRLTDTRDPNPHTHVKTDVTDFAHHTSHESGGSDEIKLDDLKAPDDNTDLNVSTLKHGLTPKLPNDATKYLDGTGNYTVPPGGSGESNTTSNQGTGEGTLALAKSGVDLPFKTIKAGSNITIDNNTDDVTINSTGGGSGESNTASNIGTAGVGVFKDKSGVDLRFKKVNPVSSKVTITDNTTDNQIDIDTPDAIQEGDSRLTDARTPTAHTHVKADVTDLVDATTATKGIVELATDGENAANVVVQGNDSRLSDSRTPIAHASSHKSGGGDAIKLDELAAPTDVTTLNASTTAHGLLKKLSNNASEFLNGQGNFAVPPDTGEANTNSNAGTGEGTLVKTKSGVDTPIKTLKQGANITLTNNANDVTIAATDTGEANTTSNAGTGEGTLAKAKSGVDLPIKSLKQGANISLTNNTNDVTIAVTGISGTAREDLVAAWDVSSTKTNIGTSYVDIYTQANSEGKPFYIDFNGKSQYRVVLYWNKIGSGTQQVKFCDTADPTNNILHNFSNAVSGENDSGLQSIPAFAANTRIEIKIMALSSTSQDDPVFESARIYLK